MIFNREPAREANFYTQYKLKPEIYLNYEANPDNTWKKITLKFLFHSKEWILTEYYQGTTNTTDLCTLTGTDEIFRNPKGAFNDAERKLVTFMKDGS